MWQDATPIETVLEAVAEREDCDVTELSPPVHQVIDPEALDTLFESRNGHSGRTEGAVRFSYLDYRIEVRADGQVSVEG